MSGLEEALKPNKYFLYLPLVTFLLLIWSDSKIAKAMKDCRKSFLQKHQEQDDADMANRGTTDMKKADHQKPYYSLTDWWDGRSIAVT